MSDTEHEDLVESVSALVFDAARAYCEDGEVPVDAVLIVALQDIEGNTRVTYCAGNNSPLYALEGLGHSYLRLVVGEGA